ncbi:MAG: hypothetical protein M3Z24_05270 [Chloroflexota bacterium]|nr:hypothetical protein [Chloroflexota bacterium]
MRGTFPIAPPCAIPTRDIATSLRVTSCANRFPSSPIQHVAISLVGIARGGEGRHECRSHEILIVIVQ